MEREGVNRREALRVLAAGVGATALWIENLRALADEHAIRMRATVPDAEQVAAWKPAVLSAHQLATVGVLVELIIPATGTPGAKAAQVDRYVDTVLAAAERPDRDKFVSGLAWLDARSKTLFRTDFVSAAPAAQTDLLTRLSAEGAQAREALAGVEFFTAIKALTITGYYSTEIGLRQELGDDGRLMLTTFEGCTHPEHQPKASP